MKTATIIIKATSKMNKAIKQEIPTEYQWPETWQEAIEMDGSEAKAFKTYLDERKTNFMDKIRNKAVKSMDSKIAEIIMNDVDLKAKLEAAMA